MEFLRVKKSSLGLDMAPLIDIVFQLLIFFMLTSAFSYPIMKLDLPKAATSDPSQSKKIVISLDRAGTVSLNSQTFSLSELKSVLEKKLAEVSDKSVHIQGDEQMPYRYFVQVMDTAREAGATRINIIHKK